MSEQNWIEMNGVKVNRQIAQTIIASNLVVIPPPTSAPVGKPRARQRITVDDYPRVGQVPEFCASCGAQTCGCFRASVKRWLLHFFVFDFYNPGVRTEGSVIHHKNHDKLDARIKNLGLGTPRTHALAHRVHRQKYSKRPKEWFAGFRFHPPQPAPVIDRPELIGLTLPIQAGRPRVASKAQRMRELDDRLARLWEPLSRQMVGMDSGAAIPRDSPTSAWCSGSTRKLGIKMPRLELTPGEATLVLLAVKHGFEFESMSRESGEPEDYLRLFMKSPAVDIAISRWRSHQRLPLATK